MVDELDKALNDVERITKEYGEFAYIVSHDFAAPLRHVREFTRLLLASTNEELNEEQQEYKDFVDRSLDKLDGMQNSMLTFSRINTQGAEFTQTETAKLVESALALLDTEIKDSDANVEFENLPSVKADTNQLQTVFFELISNGIKFHREGVPAAVTVSAQSANDTNSISGNCYATFRKYFWYRLNCYTFKFLVFT